MFTITLYIIWFLIPAFFFLTALWSKLEQLSGSPRRQNPGDFLSQGFFLLACALCSMLIDHYWFAKAQSFALAAWVPKGVVRVLLFPVVLLLGAYLVGGSKKISIKDPRGKRGR